MATTLEIVRRIWCDLTGRAGLGLDNVDEETQAEMARAWYRLTADVLHAPTEPPPDLLEQVRRRSLPALPSLARPCATPGCTRTTVAPGRYCFPCQIVQSK